MSESSIVEVAGGVRLAGELRPPGDKSISHRGLLFGALAPGTSRIHGLLDSEDVAATRRLVEAVGTRVEDNPDGSVTVTGGSARREPSEVIDCANSGTTTRLGMGWLSGLAGTAVLTGDGSLRGRPMRRVVEPLTRMGARFLGRQGNDRLPLAMAGGELQGISWDLQVASGQIKGALLLAGIQAQGRTSLGGRLEGRDHTERMLRASGIPVEARGSRLEVEGPILPEPFELRVPADPSSAAFFLVAAAFLPGSDVVVRGVGLNPGRLGFVKVLQAMGADLEVEPEGESLGEPYGTLRCRGGALRGVTWTRDWVVEALDEIPVLAVASVLAEGETVIREAEELRVKESDRIVAIATGLRRLGATIEELPDGLRIQGPARLGGAEVEAQDDHRIAMSLALAGLAAEGTTRVRGAEAVSISYPRFFEDLGRLRA